MLTEIITANAEAPVMVLFGGNPVRRQEVLLLIKEIGGINAYATLSEEEGMEKLKALPRVDLVLIGGRYSGEERTRIKNFVDQNLPGTLITEPGYDYPYDNTFIKMDIKKKLKIK